LLYRWNVEQDAIVWGFSPMNSLKPNAVFDFCPSSIFGVSENLKELFDKNPFHDLTPLLWVSW
jgi:hypothetical protein